MASDQLYSEYFKEREVGTPFAVYYNECPDVDGKPGLSRGYLMYKLLQLLEKNNGQPLENEERDIKRRVITTN